jgi:DNA-3-methyladenine glycosylase
VVPAQHNDLDGEARRQRRGRRLTQDRAAAAKKESAISAPRPLRRSFYDRDVVQVARDLLGRQLVRLTGDDLIAGRIVEVEAYRAHDDAANHAHRSQTKRNAAMFGPPGHAYVYAIHARFCFNVVTEPPGVPSAVLIRAVEPLEGIELMQERRGTTDSFNLARGPARLCEAFAIDRGLNGCDLTRPDQLWITPDSAEPQPFEIVTTARIGVTSAKELPLRFFVADSPLVSARRKRQTR